MGTDTQKDIEPVMGIDEWLLFWLLVIVVVSCGIGLVIYWGWTL